ncbi:hypothetical protein Goari_027328 [Gossypium aridum]|uniref:Reverse transcriptase zinc-binding domain-containing protein n=1 Tax=Gossypium aridum TaxID=34290 RepID=A0A7J8YNH0_GOSAI|nr:hypothetical protein [Gossypium aridum]
MGLGPHRFFWKALWKLDTIPKVRVFTWRVGHEILPTNVKIASIQRGSGQGCPRCGAEYKPLIHAVKDCHTSRTTLSIGGWNEITILKGYKSCIDWLEDMMRVLDKRAMANLMTTMWNCWNNRNNFIFRGKEKEVQVIWDRASTLSQDFRICNLMNEPIGYGAIARDDDGFVLGGGGVFIEKTMLVEEAECHAFKASIKMACPLKNHSTDVRINGARIKACKEAFINFKSADLIWTSRSCNVVTDLICTKICKEAGTWFFYMDYPMDIHDAAICDATL